nr:probable serine/threonine-protein kinase kinX [Onthophagus taurus]
MSNRTNFCNDQYQESISMEQAILVQGGDLESVSEPYITTNGDGTQYLSILDSQNEIVLNEMNDVDFEHNPMSQPEEEGGVSDEQGGQVVLYRVDDSDELYGVQFLQDETGILRKYQFKVRQTEDGILEALPDTLQVIPLDDEEIEQIPEVPETPQNPIFVKQEQQLLSEADGFNQDVLFERDPRDTKEGILGHKQALLETVDESAMDFEENQIFHESMEEVTMEKESNLTNVKVEGGIPEISFQHKSYLNEENSGENLLEEIPNTYELLKKQNQIHHNGNEDCSELVESGNIDSYLESSISIEEELEEEEEEEDDDDDDYEEEEDEEESENDSIDGDHVTGDEVREISTNFDLNRKFSYQRIPGKRKVIQNILRKIKVSDIKSSGNELEGQFYYLIRDPEKENLVKYQNTSPLISTNPRSILKTSIPIVEPTKKVAEDLEKYDKRFAKSKEAQQARQFHNYIAHTKIIHAPIRQERLPRKQKIKPMERTDEEIVVQEVFVSSNGFVETSEDGVLKERVPLQPTEFIQLSDTDDEEVEKTPRRKRKSKKKPFIEITISDSDDEDSDTVIEVPPKRPRGRPPKSVPEPSSPPLISSDSSEEEPEEIIILRVDNKCPKCPKSFPSEGSLRSHMQCHAYEEDESDVNLMCEKCGEQFKNSALLNRHAKTHVTAA